jgi:hypothetical protein
LTYTKKNDIIPLNISYLIQEGTMKKLLLIITIIFAFSGCGRNTVIDTSTPTPTEVEVHQEQVEIPTGDYDQVFGENIETRFELTESQRAL